MTYTVEADLSDLQDEIRKQLGITRAAMHRPPPAKQPKRRPDAKSARKAAKAARKRNR